MIETAKDFIELAVKPGTRASNLAALAIWEEFRLSAADGYGLYLLNAPTTRDAVLILLDFVVWAAQVKEYGANAIKVLCGKIRWNFIGNIGDTSIFDNPSFRTALKGLAQHRQTSVVDLKKSPNNALLWILPLNDLARESLWTHGVQDDRMTYVGISLMFNFSLRLGEVANVGPYNRAPRFTPDHRFYWCDIILEGTSTNEDADYTFSQYKAILPRPKIEMIMFVKNSSKTSGREKPDGKPYYLTRNSNPEEMFLEDFLTWIEDCNHTNENLPIAGRIHPLQLSSLDLHSKRIIQAMNTVGKTQGLQGFSGKSLRGGGSSSLAAAGYSDSQILNSVGHRSISSNQHYQSGTVSGNVYAMGAGNPISMRDVHRVSTVIHMNQSRNKKPRA